MSSVFVRNALAVPLLLATTGCGNDVASNGAAPAETIPASAAAAVATTEMPPIPERYRRHLTKAFQTASEGHKSPTMDCVAVVARAAGNPMPDGVAPDPDNVRAFELCYIDVAVRYIDTLLAQVTPGSGSEASNEVCAKIASYGVISRTSLGSFAGNVGLDLTMLDNRLLEHVKDGMMERCPDQIEALIGYR